jgi:Asp-tRNA(Asn)/Glu-tRNA(Gln) amidotransferase A subunit family amidase
VVDETASALPLQGISLGVKDLIDVAGFPTRAGSLITSPAVVTTDADCVARLRALGAVVQGKTVTTEFGYFSPGPTRNPFGENHTPGGSSSGSAAAVGSGTIPLALGSQTAGSLTRPASYCGAAGMVLAHGTTSLTGIVGLSHSLDSLGLLTRSVEDLRLVFHAFNEHDATTFRADGAKTVFLWGGSGLDEVAPSMRRLLEQLPVLVNNLAVECRPLNWDDHVRTLAADHFTVMAYEAARTRAQELSNHGEALSAILRQLLDEGGRISAVDHQAALARRDRSAEMIAESLGAHSLVLGPAALGPAPAGLSATGSPILSRPWQLLGLPVVVVPGARTEAGLPLGIQIVGLPGRESDMLDFGAELEMLLRGLPPIPDGTPP